MDRRIELKIKIKSLMNEAQHIRREERMCKRAGDLEVLCSLHFHRVAVVRKQARRSLLAYGCLRGMPYERIEANPKTEPDWTSTERIYRRFGGEGDFEGWRRTRAKDLQATG